MWASSGMTTPEQQAEMNQHLYRTVFGIDSRKMTIGEIFRQAKSQISDPDIRRTWILLGDPSMKLK